MSDFHDPETHKEFLEKMSKRYKEYRLNPEMLAHRIDYLWKEHSRMSSNEAKLWKGCDELDTRIKDLEETCVGLSSEIRDLQKERDLGIERLKALEDSIRKKEQKVPHKCPVCNGNKKILIALAEVFFDEAVKADLPISKDCHACNATGIVWGDA